MDSDSALLAATKKALQSKVSDLGCRGNMMPLLLAYKLLPSTRIFSRVCSRVVMRMQVLLLLLILLLRSIEISSNNSSSSSSADLHSRHRRRATEESWYTRYPAYPPYCATPDEMERRRLPPLQTDKRLGETRLRHVTAVLRHGARTPWASGLNCWDGYDTNPETSIWDCNLTAYLAPPPPEEVSKKEGKTTNHDDAMFLFEKRYDALSDPDHNLNNHLRGSCQLGQLLLQGYEQEFTNGQFLREAYVYDESAYDHDTRMRLLDISDKHAIVWNDIYYRVDDESRTLMSGQVVLRGLFGPELDAYFESNKRYPVIPLHTADFGRDILEANHDICPRLSEIWERSEASPGFQLQNNSAEAVLLRRFQTEVLKVPQRDRDMDAIDCMMTTMCTDRTLPDAINDYRPVKERSLHQQSIPFSSERELHNDTVPSEWSDEYGADLFQRLHDFDAQQYVYNIKANDGEYAKLAMNPLWYEIMNKIYPHVQDASNNLVKLAVFSGHDTTLMPLLASLGVWNDSAWAPYASMVVIELHEMNVDGNTNREIFPTNFAFRLIYNGVVITPHVSGCTPDLELCSFQVLVNSALVEYDCARKYSIAVPYKDAVTRTKEIVSTTEGVFYMLLVISISAIAGGAVVYVFLIRCFPKQRYHQADGDEYGNSMNGNGISFQDRGAEYRDEPAETELT